MIVPVAYEFEGITLCPECALRATRIGLMIAGVGTAFASMDEAIAAMALAQVTNGMPIAVPEATVLPATDECMGRCGKPFRTLNQDAAEGAA